NQTIDYIQTDYLEFQPRGKFDMITMIMCDYCALSPVQRKVLLGTFHKCLNETGAVLLDVYSMNAFSAREEACFYERNQLNHFWSADEYYCFVNTFKYESHAVMLDKYSIFQMNGKVETVFNWLQYFSPQSLKKELLEAGFIVENVFKDVAGNAFSEHGPEFAVVARKRPETVSGGI
ncbi:MAG: class I SAM-dependent methyltransferase, partial [Pseudomonadota bacterium]